MVTQILIHKNGKVLIKGKCGSIFEGKCQIKKNPAGDKMALVLDCDLERVMKNKLLGPSPKKPHPKSVPRPLSNPVKSCPIDMKNFKPKKRIKSDKDLVDYLLR